MTSNAVLASAGTIATPKSPSKHRKASFNLPEADLDKLRALAERRSVTITQALREAIADSDFLAPHLEANDGILIKTQGGAVRRVHFAGR